VRQPFLALTASLRLPSPSSFGMTRKLVNFSPGRNLQPELSLSE